MHFCPQELAAIMIVLDGVLPFSKAIYYTKVYPILMRIMAEK